MQTSSNKPQPTLADLVERAFSVRMRAARTEIRMAQTTLAHELDKRFGLKMDGTAITRIERRVNSTEAPRPLRLGEAVAIASILEFSLTEILEPDLDRQISTARSRLERAQDAAAEAERNVQYATEHLHTLIQVAEENARETGATIQDGTK
jgi:hypothetical protein